MGRRTMLVMAASAVVLALVVAMTPVGAKGRPDAGVVYVVSQGLYYETFVTADPLPNKGPFQRLFPGSPSYTLYGPGDPGYLGGRWWVDVNGNDERDAGDHFFLCPLLGPGSPLP